MNFFLLERIREKTFVFYTIEYNRKDIKLANELGEGRRGKPGREKRDLID